MCPTPSVLSAHLAAFILLATGAIAEDHAVDIGSRRQLFVDRTLIESSRNVRLTMNPPRRTGELLITTDAPWETTNDRAMIGLYSSVLKEEGKVRIWYDLIVPTGDGPYDHQRRVCYAESDDGIHFRKPQLGLHEIDGSTANNVVLPGVIGGCAVWIDPNAPAEHRYKTQAKVYPSGRLCMHSSPDGLRWKHFADLEVGPGGWDTQTIVHWDTAIKRYVMFTRRWVRPEGDKSAQYRTVRRLESEDLLVWTGETTALEADEIDLASYKTPTGQPPVDFYGASVFVLPECDRTAIMLAQAFWHFLPTEQEGRLGPSTFDVQLCISRDGTTFARAGARRPFMGLGPAGGFDSRWVWAIPNPVRVGNEIWIYYVGANRDHNDRIDPASPGGRLQSGISRAVMRLDGFISADAPYDGGELITPVIRFQGQRLELNVDTGAGGSVRVELLDATGKPVDGFREDEALPLLGNAVHVPVTWRGKTTFGELAGRPVRLRFIMRDAKLYSFQFRD